MDALEVKKLLEHGLPAATVDVNSPDNTHFMATIVSPEFAGMTRIARHQKVYAALDGRVGGDIHALSMQTLTPEENG